MGGFFMGVGHIPLYKIDRDYANAPYELLFGKGVKADNLNAHAFSRALNDLYKPKHSELTRDILPDYAEDTGSLYRHSEDQA